MIYYKNSDRFSRLASMLLNHYKYEDQELIKGIDYPNSDYFLDNDTYILVGLPKINSFSTDVIYVNPFVDKSNYRTDLDYKNALSAVQDTLGLNIMFDNVSLTEISKMLVSYGVNTISNDNSFFKFIYGHPISVNFVGNNVNISAPDSDISVPRYSLYDYDSALIAIGTFNQLKQEDILRLNNNVDAVINFDLSTNNRSVARYIDISHRNIAKYFLSEHGFNSFKETNYFGYGVTDINLNLILGIEEGL